MNDTMKQYQEYVITEIVKRVEPLVIDSAEGAIVTDINGRAYIDCFSGISVVNTGHCNPAVIDAASQQMRKLVHCASYVYHSQPTAALAEKLAHIMPGRGELRKTFFANSGAEAVEGALRLAKLYTGKQEIIALQMSFHGRTWAGLSITGNSKRKRGGAPFAPGVAFAPPPYCYRSPFGPNPEECKTKCARSLEDVINFSTSDNVAAFIAEPILGEGGIIVPPDGYFELVKEILDRHNILFICDEVQTGFCRTGKMFAIQHSQVVPDILVTAKGIANGFPLGGFTTRPEIAAAFKPGDHLSTFGGNPVSCAAALANIDFLEQEHIAEQVTRKGNQLMEMLRRMQKKNPLMGDIRGRGLMIGIELVKDSELTPASAEVGRIKDYCLEHGVLVGTGGVYGNVIRIQPPLVIDQAQLETATKVLEAAIHNIS